MMEATNRRCGRVRCLAWVSWRAVRPSGDAWCDEGGQWRSRPGEIRPPSREELGRRGDIPLRAGARLLARQARASLVSEHTSGGPGSAANSRRFQSRMPEARGCHQALGAAPRAAHVPASQRHNTCTLDGCSQSTRFWRPRSARVGWAAAPLAPQSAIDDLAEVRAPGLNTLAVEESTREAK